MSALPHQDTGALITGGSQGLGLAIAKRLVEEGCTRVVITSRNPEKGANAVAELTSMGASAHCLPIEMANISAVQAMVGQAADLIGPVNALVNCAANTERGTILDTTPDHYDAIMTVNAKAPFFALQAFANVIATVDMGVVDQAFPAHCCAGLFKIYSHDQQQLV